MTIKEAIGKIKLFLENEKETENVNLTDIKTKDGIILSYEGELVVGVEIFVVDESGRNPAPDGEYILEDNSKLKVVSGKIEEIMASEEPIEEPAEQPVEETKVEETKTSLSLEEVSDRLTKLETENLEMKKILTDLAESFSKKEFKEEVKMSMVENTEKLTPEKLTEKPLNNANRQLNNIFNNMYNKKLY
jgi:hypothetical protein